MRAKHKIIKGILFGAAAGIFDSLIMLAMKSGIDAILSAFMFWVITGFFISAVESALKSVFKGIVISLILLIPVGIPLAWQEPASTLPMIGMTALIGGILGYFIK